MITEVSVTLDGEEIPLAVNLKAAIAVNKIAGGFVPLFNRIAQADFEVFGAIIAAGSGRSLPEIEAAVFRSGVTDIVAPITEYVTILATGGRKPNEPKDGAESSGER